MLLMSVLQSVWPGAASQGSGTSAAVLRLHQCGRSSEAERLEELTKDLLRRAAATQNKRHQCVTGAAWFERMLPCECRLDRVLVSRHTPAASTGSRTVALTEHGALLSVLIALQVGTSPSHE